MNLNDLLSNLTLITVLGGALLVLLLDLFLGHRTRWIAYGAAQLTVLLTAFFIWQNFWEPTSFQFGQMLVHDVIGSLFQFFICVSMLLTFAYARSYLNLHNLPQGEFYSLSLFTLLGMLLLTASNHLLILFLGLELSSLPLYALIASKRENPLCTEAAMKYYLMGSVASGILLYAISLAYGAADSFNIQTILHTDYFLNHPIFLVIILVFFVTTIVFKLGAAPFHMWAPDVYQGAPTPVTLFISTAPKIAALAMLFRLLIEMLPGFQVDWQKILLVVSMLSFIFGNIAAIAQTNIKRMLAYSSIAHMGYMLLGLVAGGPKGYAAAVFYMIAYTITTAGAFALVSMLARAGLDVGDIRELRGLNNRHPVLALAMLMMMFSMAGIPPFVGFFAKLTILEALIAVHMSWLAVLALIASVIGAYYYLAVVKVMYFEETETPYTLAASLDSRILLFFNGLAVLFLGLFPSVLYKLCQLAVLNV